MRSPDELLSDAISLPKKPWKVLSTFSHQEEVALAFHKDG
jgi:hypothetical protein